MAYVLTVGGTTKSMLPGWSMTETVNGRATFTCEILSTAGTYRPAIGAEVILTEGGTTIFGGYIDAPAEHGIGARGDTAIATRISCVDYNSLGDRRFVINGGFPAGYTMLQCITSLAGYLTAYGVAVDAAQATGTNPLAAPIVYDVKSITAILNELAVVFSGLDSVSYIWRIDPATKKLRMYSVGTFTAPVNITEAARYAEGDVTVEPTRANYANRIIVQAGTGTSEVTDTWTATSGQTVFPLTYQFVSHGGYVSYGTGPVVNEPIGVTTPPYWVVDPVAGTITRSSGATVGKLVSITYIAQFPYRAQADDAGEQATNGLWEKVLTAPDIFSSAVAEALADGYLARSITTSQTARYVTRQLGIKPGQTQTITLSKRNLSGTFLITDVQTQDVGSNVVKRTVTATSGTTYQGSWRDDFASDAGSSGTTVGSVTIITGGSGTAGSGTAGTLPRWATTTTLGNSLLSESGSVLTMAGTMTATTFSGSGASLTSLPAGQLTGTITSATQDLITRTGTLVAGATGAGFTIALTTSTVTGNLPYARMPSGSGTWTGTPTISGDLTLSSNLLPALTDTSDLGSATKLWRLAYIAQINAVLFAKETQTLYGGWLAVSKNAGVFAAAVASGNADIDFGTAMTLNQFVLVRGINTGGTPATEYFKVGSLVSGTRYNVTRNLSGAGAQNWAMGTPFQVRGVAGDGWLELNAFDTPRMSIFTQGSLYNNSVETIRIGHLSGMPNSSSGIGSYMGDSSNYMRWDGTELKLVSSTVSIGSTGISVTPNTASTFDNDNAYRFTVTNGTLGTGGSETGAIRRINIESGYTGLTSGGPALACVMLAGWSPSDGGSEIASLQLDAAVGGSNISMSAETISVGSGATSSFLLQSTTISITGDTTFSGGVVSATAFGTHTFTAGGTGANRLDVINTSSGTGNTAQFRVTAGTTTSLLIATSQGYTAGTYDKQAATVLQGVGAGGVSIVADSGAEIRFYTGTTQRARFDTNGDFVPGADNTRSCGVSVARWVAVWAVNGAIQTSDADLKDGIRQSDIGRDFLMALSPVAWQWKDGTDTRDHYGFTAQAVAAALGQKTFGGLYRDADGKPIGLNYTAFIAPLVSGFQDHETRLAAIERRFTV